MRPVSICIGTFNKKEALRKVLHSIFIQEYPKEVIVIDDASSDGTEELRKEFPIFYRKLSRGGEANYRNPSVARNLAMIYAKNDVLVLQSDEVIHTSTDTLEKLASVGEKEFLIAEVWNVDANLNRLDMYTGEVYRRPFFFLGSVLRKHVYSIGGNCDDFMYPGYEDNWFADCLMHGEGLLPRFPTDIVGYHQDHPRPDTNWVYSINEVMYRNKYNEAQCGRYHWKANRGSWPENMRDTLDLTFIHDLDKQLTSLDIYNKAFSDPSYNVHTEDEFRYLFVLKALDIFKEYSTLLDIGSGRGTLLVMASKHYPNLAITSADLTNYHNLHSIPFFKVDLNDIKTPIGKFDIITCMDVLEHLNKNTIENTLTELATSCKVLICSIANHSDVKDGVELHTIQEGAEYWEEMFKGKFEVVTKEDRYRLNDVPRLHLYVLQSLLN